LLGWNRSQGAVLYAVALSALSSGCATVRVWEIHPEPAAQAVRNVVGEHPFGDPENAPAQQFNVSYPVAPNPVLVRGLACFDSARGYELGSRRDAMRFYVEAMAYAYESMFGPSAEAPQGSTRQQAEARSLYNRSLERFLRLTGGHRILVNDAWCRDLSASGIPVAIRRDAEVWSPERFDELRFTGDFVVRGMDHYYGADGLGVPLIAVRKPSGVELDRRQGPDRFYPYWEVYPVTALLRFERTSIGRPRATLELHDTLRFTCVEVDGRAVQLAADLTTPTAYHFARGKLARYERISLFTPQRVNRQSGVHMLHPYERGKIPVVMIHGLGSSPKAWGRVVNELRGDPLFRERFQFWMFMYPTGDPFMLSAAQFRQSLEQARQVVDPGQTDRAFDEMVLIGHSMGGLIARLAITDSRDDFWHLISKQPFDRLVAQPDDRDVLGRAFFFEPLPFVKRVVFIATPHRGSKLGDELIGRLGDRLIRLPSPLVQAHNRLVADNGTEFFTKSFTAGVPSSIDELELDNPYLVTLKRLPVAQWVTAHSVIGKIGYGPLETSSDGVVPYSSSHIDWSASEQIIPESHFCQDSSDAITELRRILKLHLGEAHAL
jgi:pimeloyl-ACP methyl ester carboxylesterase